MQIDVLVFIIAISALSYTYIAYPALLAMLTRGRRPEPPLSTLPSVSVIIPFHNEERWAAKKIQNTLAWNYPADRLQVIAVSDGSTDRTSEILARYAPRIVVIDYKQRRGKPSALNAGVAKADGDILVFTDANVLALPSAVRKMVRHYGDPSIGGVSGNVALQAEGTTEPLGEGVYMRYERWLYERESRLKTMVGADGALFSVRRSLYSPLAADTVADDFHIALDVVARGRRVVFDAEARAVEVVVPDVAAEFRRKIRMIAGGYQAVSRHVALLNPFRRPIVTWALGSHKVLRWLVPVFLGAALLTSLVAASPWVQATAIPQALFYLLAVTGWVSRRLRQWMPVYVPYYFCAVNVAAALGLWRYLLGRQSVVWQKVDRSHASH